MKKDPETLAAMVAIGIGLAAAVWIIGFYVYVSSDSEVLRRLFQKY